MKGDYKMKKAYMLFTTLVLCTLVLTGCNSTTKNFGGTMIIDLPENQKLVEATWKDSNLWYLTKPMNDTDIAEEYTFHENSNLGLMEGKVILKESKKEDGANKPASQDNTTTKASKSEMNSTTQK